MTWLAIMEVGGCGCVDRGEVVIRKEEPDVLRDMRCEATLPRDQITRTKTFQFTRSKSKGGRFSGPDANASRTTP